MNKQLKLYVNNVQTIADQIQALRCMCKANHLILAGDLMAKIQQSFERSIPHHIQEIGTRKKTARSLTKKVN